MPDNINSEVQILVNNGELQQVNVTVTKATHYMKYFLAKLLAGKSVGEQSKYLAFGSGTNTPTEDDEKLQNELAGVTDPDRIQTYSSVVLKYDSSTEYGYVASLSFIDDSKAQYTASELGIFLEPNHNSGMCLARSVLQTPIVKTESTALAVEWRFKIV